jgi:hypothetical protein
MMLHLYESLKTIAWGIGTSTAGTAVIAVYRGVRSLDAQLTAQLDEQTEKNSRLETQVKASAPDIGLTILGGFVDSGRILLKVRAVHRSTEVSVRDWTLRVSCKGHPWKAAIPIGLRVEEDRMDFEEPSIIPIVDRLDDILRSSAPRRGIGVDGWLLFKFAGSVQPELEEVLRAPMTLTAHDDFGGLHTGEFIERPYGSNDEFGLAYGAIVFP